MKSSAGILAYRNNNGIIEVLLAHTGGPFWKNKDAGAWSIPKGELLEGEDPLRAAQREFTEETSFTASEPFTELGEIKMKDGKIVKAWASYGDFDLTNFKSNTFSLEWPPRSGKMAEFPEVDRADYFTIEEAKTKVFQSQIPLLDSFEKKLTGLHQAP